VRVALQTVPMLVSTAGTLQLAQGPSVLLRPADARLEACQTPHAVAFRGSCPS